MSFSRNKKRIAIGALIIFIGGFIGYKITYKPHETIQDMQTDFKGSGSDLLQHVEQNPLEWNDKVVEIEGKVTQTEPKHFMINTSIYCQKNMNTPHFGSITIGNTYHIKGRIIGYDDLLEELKLDKVILIK